MSMTYGVELLTFFGRDLRATDFARYTYAVTLFITFYDLFVLGVFLYRGGNGYHFQGSRDGNDTRLHCLGTVEYLGLLFFFSIAFHLLRLFSSFIVSLYIGFGGLVNNPSLPLVCGWLGLVASETMGCGVVPVLKSISLGVSRGQRV
jgi:hypothetical protein